MLLVVVELLFEVEHLESLLGTEVYLVDVRHAIYACEIRSREIALKLDCGKGARDRMKPFISICVWLLPISLANCLTT